ENTVLAVSITILPIPCYATRYSENIVLCDENQLHFKLALSLTITRLHSSTFILDTVCSLIDTRP
ncbi:hypothetical protein, partial [Vibrio parahaemolyticus]|uniref:hypothetical protein n=1 Tax=Vibrio parahaemolyticus TaxID=670 RepID=UPI001E44EF5B